MTLARRHALLIASMLFGIVSLAFVSPRLDLGWDEVVYVSQYGTHAPAAYMSAPRAWGVTLLAGPIASWTDSVLALRLYLTLMAAAALGLAFWPWIRVLRSPVLPAAAAGLYGSLWIALFYSGSAMPNHYTAMAAVAAVGWILNAASNPSAKGPAVGVAVALGVSGLMRPSDAFILLAAVLVATACVRSRRTWRCAATAVGGFAGGVLPWMIDAQLHYGGVVQRLRLASEVQGGTGLTFSLPKVIMTLDGPPLCRPCASPVQWPAVLWWLGLAVLVPVGTLAMQRSGRRLDAWLPVGAALAMAVPYLFLISYSAPRFLLATYALLFLPTAAGANALMTSSTGRRCQLLVAATALAIVGHTVIQAGILHYVANNQHREDWSRVAQVFDGNGIRPPCVVTGTEASPIAYYARCRALEDGGNNQNASTTQLIEASHAGSFALVLQDGPPPPWAADWKKLPITGLAEPTWTLYIPQTTKRP